MKLNGEVFLRIQMHNFVNFKGDATGENVNVDAEAEEERNVNDGISFSTETKMGGSVLSITNIFFIYFKGDIGCVIPEIEEPETEHDGGGERANNNNNHNGNVLFQ